MMERKGFFWRFLNSLNPLGYDELAEKPMSEAFFYVPKLLLMATILMILCAIPVLIGIPGYVDQGFSKLNELSMNLTFEQNEPIKIPAENPQFVIDKKANASSIGNSRVLITETTIVMKPLLCQFAPSTCFIYNFGDIKNERNIEGYSNVLAHRQDYVNLFSWMIFMMLPSIIFLIYVAYLIKYLVIAIVFAVIATIISRLSRYEINFSDVLKITLYSLTLMVLVEMISIPFQIRLYYLNYALFVIYIILGILKTGYRDNTPRKKKKKQRGYVELEDRY